MSYSLENTGRSAFAMRSLGAVVEHPTKGSLLLALMALLWLLPGFFSLPPIDRDESRFAQATRQMMQSGDLIDIRFQDMPRYKKPAGIYWLQSAANWISGGSADNPTIWRFRLPSLAGAITALLLTAWIGRILFSPSIGFLTGLILAASPLFGVEARQATTDAVQLAFILAAMVGLLRVYLASFRPAGHAPPGLGNAAMFWIAIGAGLLIKGPVILLFVGLTALMLALIEKRAGWLTGLRPLPGVLLALALGSPWFIAIMAKSDGAFIQQSLGHDLLGKITGVQEGHSGWPGYYAATVFLGFWPFVLPLGLALSRLLQRRNEPAVRFCIAWLLPSWVVLEFVPTKLPHYVLPLYPALALLTAYAVARNLASLSSDDTGWQRRLGWANLAVTIVIGLGLAGLGLWVPLLLHQPVEVMAWPYALVTAAALSIGGLLTIRGRSLQGLICLLVACQLASFSTFGRLLPHLEVIWPSRLVAEAVQAYADCAKPRLASTGYEEPSLVFLAGTETLLTDPGQAAAFLMDPAGCRFALVSEDRRAAFDAAAAKRALETQIFAQFDAFNYSKGRWQRLTLYGLAASSD
jgi:4-amino-4-deoxy-L-arabinose transferase-like glycosyltransferase